MRRTLLFSICYALFFGTYLVGQEPLLRPVPIGGVGTDTIGKLLREIGFEPKGLSPDVFQISLEKDRWIVHVMVSLSTDGNRIWLESKFAPVDAPDRVPAATWRKLLEANEKIGPAHFAFDPTDRRVHLFKSFDNRGIDRDRLLKELDGFDTTVRTTHEYWRSENFRPAGVAWEPKLDPTGPLVSPSFPAKEIPLLPAPKPAPKLIESAVPVARALTAAERLRQNWRITEIRVKGERTPAAVLAERNPSLVFRSAQPGDPWSPPGETLMADLRTDAKSKRTVRVVLAEPFLALHHSIDFVDNDDRVEKGIYKFDRDELTVCFAAPGEPRPITFDTPDTWVIKLKKQ